MLVIWLPENAALSSVGCQKKTLSGMERNATGATFAGFQINCFVSLTRFDHVLEG